MSATILQSVSSAPLASTSRRVSKSVLVGRIISGIAMAFLAFDASMKLFGVKEAVEGTVKLGFSASVLMPLGLIQAAALLLYLFPRTASLGAMFLTAYLGGAVAIHVQLGNPMFTHVLFPVYVAMFLWGGLFLRDPRVRAVLGARR